MDNTNNFDWMAVQMQSPDKSFEDLNAMGIDPGQTTLQSKDYYKGKNKIKEQFKNTDGSFNDEAYNKAYAQAESTFNDYKKTDLAMGGAPDVVANTSINRSLGLDIDKNPVKITLAAKDPFTNLKTAQKSFFGVTEINKWTKPELSIAEVAQAQNVIDGKTGEKLGYKPEDTSIFNMFGFFDEPLVLGAYDQDVRDAKGKIIHKRGEQKFDANGLPFYETLAGRDIAGKQVLSRGDTLTKEGTFANKFDFMDSDGLDKSITGSIMKSAVQYAPMLIGGPIGTALTAYYIASGLIDASAEITKSLDAIINGPDAKNDSLYKWANQAQGYTAQIKGGTSEYSKQHPFSIENILNQAVDSVYQLKSQKALVEWPLQIAKFNMAKKLGLAEGTVVGSLMGGQEASQSLEDTLFEISNYASKNGHDEVGLLKAAKALTQNANALKKYGDYAQYMSTAFMAATSAVGISQAADAAGLDARDKGFMYAGYVATLIPLFNSTYSHFIEHRIGGLDDFAKGANAMLNNESEALFATVKNKVDDIIPPVTEEARKLNFLAQGRELGKGVWDKLKNVDPRSLLAGMATETFEEMTEQSLQYALEGIYNGFSASGLKSSQDGTKFDMDPIEVAKDIAMNGLGGAFGGAIFHLADHNYVKAFRANGLDEYVINGFGDQVRSLIDKAEQNGLGDKTLSITPLTDDQGNVVPGKFKPVNSDNPVSQNAFIADRLRKTVTYYEGLMHAHDIMNPNVAAASKDQLYQNIVDTKLNTDFRDQHQAKTKEIFALAADIESITNLNSETDEGMLKKKAEMKQLEKDLQYLQSDDSIDEFFRQGLFNIRPDISQNFGVKNKESMAQELANKPYRQLSDTQRDKVDKQYDEYKNDDGSTGLRANLKEARAEYERFNKAMEDGGHYKNLNIYRQSLLDVEKVIKTFEDPYWPADQDFPVALGATHELTTDYLTKLQNIKYIPNYIYDILKEKLGDAASHEATHLLGSLSPIREQFSTNVNKSLRTGLDSKDVRHYVGKLVGKDFEDFLESDEYKDVSSKTIPKSNYSTLYSIQKLTQFHDTANTQHLREQFAIIDNLPAYSHEIEDKLYDYEEGRIDKHDPVLAQFDQVKGLFDYIEELRAPKGDSDGYDVSGYEHLFNANELKRFVIGNDIIKKNQLEPDFLQKEELMNSVDPNNIFLSMLTEGKFNAGDNVLYANTVKSLNSDSLNQAVDMLKNFNVNRISSPLSDTILKDTFTVVKDQLENLKRVQPANYLNADPTFGEGLKNHMKVIDKMRGIINAAATVNPIVNDFRQNHKALLDTKVKDEVLFQFDTQDMSVLDYELNHLKFQLKYLYDVNEYNRNNVLNRLLKDDGFELVSKIQTLRDLATSDITDLVPSLKQVFNDGDVSDYVNTYQTASDDLKFEALYKMAKMEDDIYNDVQKLTPDDKTKLINLTFKPIASRSSDFYDDVRADEPLNDSHKTIYLATIFGASTTDFYSKYAGTYDKENNTYENLERSPYVPFAKQESAVRLANLVINGDRQIVKALYNAYTHEAGSEKGYETPEYTGFENHFNMILLGAPGAGKTTAALSNILNMIPKLDNNVILLAPKGRQVNSLHDSLLKAGFPDKADPRSTMVTEFLKSLGIVDKNKVLYDIDRLTQAMQYADTAANTGEGNVLFNKMLTDQFTVNEDGKETTKPGIFKDMNLTQPNGDLNKDLMKALANINLIAIDEFTHVNPVELAVLEKIVNLYNNSREILKDPSKAIHTVMLGDENQMGFVKDGVRRDYTVVTNNIISQPLLTSLRSGWDLINNTLTEVGRSVVEIKGVAATRDASALVASDFVQKYKNQEIGMYHAKTDEGNVGMKVIRSDGNLSAADLSFISQNKALTVKGNPVEGKNIVYVINSDDERAKAESLLRQAFGENWPSLADIEVYTPDEVQGGEYKYAIIAASPKMTSRMQGPNKVESEHNIVRAYEFLNTMLSRGTEATLLIDNGSMDQFATFNNVEKERAINQIKIDADVIKKVKANKQRLLDSILRDRQDAAAYVKPSEQPIETADETAEQVPAMETQEPPVTPDTSEEQEPIKPTTSPSEIPVVPIEKATAVFTEPAPVNVDVSPAVGTDVKTYSSFITKGDLDNVLEILPEGSTREDAEKLANAYKYYLLKRGQLGEDNVGARALLRDPLENYDYDRPKYYLEFTKRKGDNEMDGRAVKYTPDPSPYPYALFLKVKIANKQGGKDLVISMGETSRFNMLQEKAAAINNKSTKEEQNFKTFVEQLAGLATGANKELPYGTTQDGTWRSKEFNQKTLDKMSTIFKSRLQIGNNSVNLDEFKNDYSELMFSDPQVVVGTIIDGQGQPLLNADGKNPEYESMWKKLKGQSIVFYSDYKELGNKSPDELLDIYMKQLSYFNTAEYTGLKTNQERADYIAQINKQYAPVQGNITWEPNLVNMLRLENPKSTFLNFRERYLTAISEYNKTQDVPFEDIFMKFDMSPYVKDRLIKSLVVIDKFLDDKANHAWFNENVIKNMDKSGDAFIAKIRQDALEFYGVTPETAPNFDEVSLAYDSSEMTTEKFQTALKDMINDPNLYRRSFNTVEEAGSARRTAPREFDSSDIDFDLTEDKQADFSKSIVDLNSANLFRKTKNLNFAQVIDLALQKFSTEMPKNKAYDKFKLDKVFTNGELEHIVVANRAAVKGNNIDNILAGVRFHSQSFTFGIGPRGYQQPAINIDFSKLIGVVGTNIQPVTPQQVIENREKIDSMLSQFDALPKAWRDNKFEALQAKLDAAVEREDVMDALYNIENAISSIDEHVEVPRDKQALSLDTVLAYDVTKNGVIGTETVKSTVIKQLLDRYSGNFTDENHDTMDLQPQKSTPNSITFKVQTEKGTFDVTYKADINSTEMLRELKPEDIDMFKTFLEHSDTKKSFEDTVKSVFGEVSKNTLSNSTEVLTRDSLLKAVGKQAQSEMTSKQIGLFLGEEWYDNEEFVNPLTNEYTDNFYRTLANLFMDELPDKEETIKGMFDVARANNMQVDAEAKANEEFNPESAATALDDSLKVKQKEIKDPMELIQKDLRDFGNSVKKDFLMKVRELFQGKQEQGDIKDALKVLERVHFIGAYRRKIAAINAQPNKGHEEITLENSGISPEALEFDSKKEMARIKSMLDNSAEFEADEDFLTDAFNKLDKYTSQTIKIIC